MASKKRFDDGQEAGAVPTVSFALGVVEHPDQHQWVLVHEKAARGWWLPGGGVDARQLFAEAMEREAEEEAGCLVKLCGVLRVEYLPGGPAARSDRLRVIYLAAPLDAAAPLKSVPDQESKGAQWASLEQLAQVAAGSAPVDDCWLRGNEPAEWFGYRAMGGGAAPLSFLHQERKGAAPVCEGADAPRAFYPTTKQVSVGLVMDDKMWLPEHSTSWPLFVREHFNQAAQRVCTAVGGVELCGVHSVRHFLDVSGEECEHHAVMHVVYVARMCSEGSIIEVARMLGCNEVPCQAQVYPLSMISKESSRVMLDGKDCEAVALGALK